MIASLVKVWDNKENALALVRAESMATPKIRRSYIMILTEDVISRYRANQGYVYLIHAIGTDRYKIGRSVNPVVRLETLKKQSPYPLQILECFWTPDAIADEKYFHTEKYLSPKRMYGEWFELSRTKSGDSSLSDFDYIELEFTGHRPTCHQYLRQSFDLIVEESRLPTYEGNYFSELYDPMRLLYLGITGLPTFEKIVCFSFENLPSIIGTCRNSQELNDRAWAACDSASQIILGRELFDIAESEIRYKGK